MAGGGSSKKGKGKSKKGKGPDDEDVSEGGTGTKEPEDPYMSLTPEQKKEVQRQMHERAQLHARTRALMESSAKGDTAALGNPRCFCCGKRHDFGECGDN